MVVRTLFLLLACVQTGSVLAQEDDSLPGYAILNREITERMTSYALARSDEDTSKAIFDLAEMYARVSSDPRYPTSKTLQGYRRRMGAKLRQAEAAVTRELKRRGASESLAGEKNKPPNRSSDSEVVGMVVSHQLELVGATLGGPSRMLDEVNRRGGFGGRPIPDFGPDLVNLIQSTISPGVWDVNGGPATVVYYRPWMMLVVRAPADTHDDVGAALGKLRE